ncbi:hypothetical protein A2635_02205 [Candidatus Peribacteria bacterium RIFCSPHIGHO2_01_FULL_51_9]|nr:MAG: hypothetical protein A2635_02205 [Candidatus Peribacteria bacterium RIFCSPHIGHO2_01_FULL_51_9]
MVEYQRVILADSVRNSVFAKALQQVIVPGCTVLDIGSGTGFLAFLAKKMGAERCILIERDPEYVRLSQEIGKKNNMRGCTFVTGHSTDVREAIAADVIVSETLGNFAYEENIIETLRDARRFLKPGGIMLPQGITQCIAPVTGKQFFEEVTSWDRIGQKLDFSPAREQSINNVYVRAIAPRDLHDFPRSVRIWDTVDLCAAKNESVRRGEVEWIFEDSATIFGFSLFWECVLVPGITISTSPVSPPTHWQQIYLPVRSPLRMGAGETLHLSVTSDSRLAIKINVEWTYERRGKDGKILDRQTLDMRRG